MKIKQDPVTGLWCREDGAVLLPPNGHFKTFRWTFGSKCREGYCHVGYRRKYYRVHQLVCRAFHDLPPAGKPFCDHINRIKDDNRPENLHWVDHKENMDNRDYVDEAFKKNGARYCDDPKGYMKAYGRTYYGIHQEERKAYAATRISEKKAQGLRYCKGPDGKYGWYPFKRP